MWRIRGTGPQMMLVNSLSLSLSLSLSQACLWFFAPTQPTLWGKLIWNVAIPPSKYLLLWTLIHNKVLIDENLTSRGLHLPSICNLCLKDVESSQHLLFDFPYALNIWWWLSCTLHINQISSIDVLGSLLNKSWFSV
jgi:hypothetical protein